MKRFNTTRSFARRVECVALPGVASPGVCILTYQEEPSIIPTNKMILGAGMMGSVLVLFVHAYSTMDLSFFLLPMHPES